MLESGAAFTDLLIEKAIENRNEESLQERPFQSLVLTTGMHHLKVAHVKLKCQTQVRVQRLKNEK